MSELNLENKSEGKVGIERNQGEQNVGMSKNEMIMEIVSKEECFIPFEQEYQEIANIELTKINGIIVKDLQNTEGMQAQLTEMSMEFRNSLGFELNQLVKNELTKANHLFLTQIKDGTLNELGSHSPPLPIKSNLDEEIQKRAALFHHKLIRQAVTIPHSPTRQVSPHAKGQVSQRDLEAKQFVKLLKKDKQHRRLRAESQIKSMMERHQQQHEDMLKNDSEKKAEWQKRRETQIEERMLEIRRRKEERDHQHSESIKQMKVIRSERPLYLKREEEYQEKVLLPKINQEKAVLNQIKETMSHRIDQHEIKHHLMKYQEQLKIMELKKLDLKHSTPEIIQSDRNLPHSNFHNQVIEEEYRKRQEARDRLEKIKQLRQKQELYDKFVKEVHPARSSPQKTLELSIRVDRLKHKVKKPKDGYDDYLAEVRREEKPNTEKHRRNKSQLLHMSDSNEFLHQPQVSLVKKRIDYLPEMREKIKKVQGSKYNNHGDWVHYMNRQDLSDQERIEMIKLKSEAMEQKAHFFESGLNVMDTANQHEVNQLYMDSIKAKMALIEHM